MFKLKLGLVAGLAVTCLSTIAAEPDQPSQIMQLSEAKAEKGDGYVFYSYFTKPTFGTQDALTGVAVI